MVAFNLHPMFPCHSLVRVFGFECVLAGGSANWMDVEEVGGMVDKHYRSPESSMRQDSRRLRHEARLARDQVVGGRSISWVYVRLSPNAGCWWLLGTPVSSVSGGEGTGCTKRHLPYFFMHAGNSPRITNLLSATRGACLRR